MNQKPLYTLFFVIIISLLPGCIGTTSEIKDSTVMRVGTSADFAPYEFIDTNTGTVIGFDMDIIQEVACRINKKIELHTMPFSSLIFDLFAGHIDLIISGLTPSESRAKKVLFSKPYLQNDALVVVTLQKHPVYNIQDLQQHTVTVNTGYTSDMYMSNTYPELELIKLKTPAESLLALQSGAAYAYITAQSTIKSFMTDKNKAEYYTYTIPDTQENYACAAHQNNKSLIEEINTALHSMHQDGTIETLMKKWNLV